MTPRLSAVVCTLAICSALRAGAQVSGEPSAFIEWAVDRPLTIKDFKGKIPARASQTSLSRVVIEASWECEGGTGAWRARAVFDPSQSWWREASPNLWARPDAPPLAAPRDDGERSLLAHEQVHFDLTELWARKIRDLLASLPAACKTPGASRGFESGIAEMESDWQAEQKRYDKETDHGGDAARQRAWAARTAKALRAAYAGGGAAAER